MWVSSRRVTWAGRMVGRDTPVRWIEVVASPPGTASYLTMLGGSQMAFSCASLLSSTGAGRRQSVPNTGLRRAAFLAPQVA